MTTGEFDTYSHGRRSATSEFGPVDPSERSDPDAGPDPLPPPVVGMTECEEEFYKSTGFEGLELARHFAIFSPETMPRFIIRDLLFETGSSHDRGSEQEL